MISGEHNITERGSRIEEIFLQLTTKEDLGN